MNEELENQKAMAKMLRELFGKIADICEEAAETDEERNQIKKAKLCNRVVDLIMNDTIRDLQRGIEKIPDNELEQHVNNIILAVTTLEEEAKAIKKYKSIGDKENE